MPITTGNEIPLTDDTISNFGKFLPAPYIERVEVYTDKVTVFVSLFLMTDLDEDTTSMIDYLSGKLNFYVMHAANKDCPTVDIWDSVIDRKMNVFAAYNEAAEAECALVNLEVLNPLNTSETWKTSGDMYDSDGNRIIKFQTSVDYGPADLDLTSLDFWNVFAFASLYEYSTDDIDDKSFENTALLDRQVSDISYERLFKDGELQHQIVSFVDADDLAASAVPIQSITGPYYKTDNITRDDMVEYFEEFVTGFKEADVHDPDDVELNNMLDSISYIVEEYGESTQFLKEMDLLRTYFPSKDPATPVGKLYTRFRKRIYTANSALENGTQVKKILNRNPKIMDLRFDADMGATVNAWIGTDDDIYIYPESFVSRAAFYYTEDDWVTAESEVARNRGYFFFDYEKALRQNAVINNIFSVNKLSSLGIGAIPYDAFRITEVSLLRTQYGADVTISCDFDESAAVNYPLPDTTTINNVDTGDWPELIIASPERTNTTSTLPEGETSYLVLRNFVPNQTDSISSGIPDYRLSCFEFQDFCNYTYATTTEDDEYKYSVSITVEDRTIEAAAGLVSYYQSVQELLATYHESATDDLSHNTFGEFNTFFSDGITSTYASAEEAPWNVAPAIYCIYQDLVYNFYDGDMDKITAAAQKIMDGLDPYVGNFFILETFKTAFDNFYTNVLAPDGDIGGIISARLAQLGFTGEEDPQTGTDEVAPVYDTIVLTYEGEVAWSSCSSETGEDGIYDVVEAYEVTGATEAVASELSGIGLTEIPGPEEAVAAWTAGGSYTHDFGVGYNDRDTSYHYDYLQDAFPGTFGSGMLAWGESGTPFTEIVDFTEDHDSGWGKSIYQRFTTPTEDGTSWVSYHIMVSEHEGKVRVREYKCPSDASGCWDQAIADDRLYDEEWEDERSELT